MTAAAPATAARAVTWVIRSKLLKTPVILSEAKDLVALGGRCDSGSLRRSRPHGIPLSLRLGRGSLGMTPFWEPRGGVRGLW